MGAKAFQVQHLLSAGKQQLNQLQLLGIVESAYASLTMQCKGR